MLGYLKHWGRRPPSTGDPNAPEAAVQQVGKEALEACGWFNAKTGELVPGFGIDHTDTIVDLGAGRGRASLFAARRGAKVIAVDSNPERVRHLRKHLGTSRAREFEVVESESNPLPIPDGIADKVVCMEVLEHVENPAQILREMVRVGKDAAEFLITVPDPVCESVLKGVAPDFYWKRPHHIRVFEREEIARFLTEAGLTIRGQHRGSFYHSLYWVFFWASTEGRPSASNAALKHWSETWRALMNMPNSEHVRNALDEFMPKNRAFIAQKAA